MSLAPILLAFALQQQERSGSVEGTVRAGGEPQPGINVSLGKQQTKTDTAGKYSLRDVPAGRHTLRIGEAFRSDTVPESRVVAVAPGQQVVADFALMRRASVSGTVLDEFDEPMAGVEIVLLDREYGAGAPRYFRQYIARTDDEGHYRFDYVRPGAPYLLLVQPGTSRPVDAMSDAPTDPRLRRPATVPTFFPGVADSAGATAITLRHGEHREGVHLRALRAPSFCVEAHLAGSNLTFQIQPAHLPFGVGPNGGVTGMPRNVKPGPDGKVRVCELPPAEYRLTALEGDLNEPLSLASAHVSLRDRDATGITLHPIPRFSIPIELAWAGTPPEKPVEAKLSLSFQSMTRSFGAFAGMQKSASPPAKLEVDNVYLDDYYQRVSGLSGRLYLKEILYGNDNIAHAPFRPGTQDRGAVLRASIGHDGAHIKAQVHDKDGKKVPGATIVVMPAVFASENELASTLRTGYADQHASFESTRAFAPGKYLIFALGFPVAEPLQSDQVTHLISLRNRAREVSLEPNGTLELSLEAGPW